MIVYRCEEGYSFESCPSFFVVVVNCWYLVNRISLFGLILLLRDSIQLKNIETADERSIT